jgi:hypothetical protein
MLRHQDLQFVFRESDFGRLGCCDVKVRHLGLGTLLVILSKFSNYPSSALERDLECIATQFRTKYLRSVKPRDIHWVIRTSNPDGKEELYQKYHLSWDGERYFDCKPMARFNRVAFLTATSHVH